MADDNSRVKKKRVERTIKLNQDYKQAFTTKQGKAVLLDLLQEHYILRSTYQGVEGDDGRGQSFREGQKHVVLRIMTLMGLDVSEMYLLLKEGDDDARKKNL